jgi:serine/threonine protein kinase/Tol biopolymer transport system component
MTLTSGVKLGPYEILSPLGAGGMGEVYRAHDNRLGRDVAIKVLPAHLSCDPVFKQRFEREAKTISSLNHPHICVLHDVGHQDGMDYLVMECVEGETLGKRLEKGPLPIEQVVKIGAEVADALDRAHRSGVVHRDLKPGNIMLTSTGAKLLDFGLAKPVVALAAAATVTVPAKDSPVTEQGTIVGTFQYMSPEQVEGKEVDGRSDIFSLGTVLYEMVTGRRAFQGKSNFSLASAILEKEPEAMSAIKPMTPAALDHAVKKCLAKAPDERWQSASDLASELKWIGESRASGAAMLPVSGSQRRRLAWIATGIGIVIAVIVSFAGGYFSRPVANDSIRSFIPAPENTSFLFVGNAGGPPVLSPDGKNLAFVASEAGGASRIYVRPLGTLEARPLSGTDNAWAPFWSPDGRKLGFFADGKLKIIDIQGGTPVSLADAPTPRGGSWSPDGTILFAPEFRSCLYRVPASGGAEVAVTRVDAPKHTSHRWPWFLPDGKHFLYLAISHQAPRDENDGIYFASLDGKENIRLKAAFTNAQYASGFLLYVRDGELVAQEFDPSTGKLHEEEKQVANGVSEDGTTWRAAFTVSPNGLLAFYPGAHVDTQLAWYDRAGKQLGTLGETFGALVASTSSAAQLRLSSAGDRAALAIQGSVNDIWVMGVARGVRQRLTFGLSSINPVWSPDGKWVAYRTVTKEGFAIARRLSAGGPEETILSAKAMILPADWSTDGKYLLYVKAAEGTHSEIWALPLVGDRTPFQIVPSGAYTSEAPRFSPDMRWIAYWSDESGRPEVYVVPFHGGGKWEISTNGGTGPIWRNDGKELFFLSLSLVVTAMPMSAEGGQLKLGAPRALFRTSVTAYDVAPGGQKFLSFVVGDRGSKPITLVTNWTADLKK